MLSALVMVGTFSDFLGFQILLFAVLVYNVFSPFFASFVILEWSHALHNNFSELNSLI